jgi:hypothetical protein
MKPNRLNRGLFSSALLLAACCGAAAPANHRQPQRETPQQREPREQPERREGQDHLGRRQSAELLRRADEAARGGDLMTACQLLARATALGGCDPCDATEVMAKIYIRGGEFRRAAELLRAQEPFAPPRQRERFQDLRRICRALGALQVSRWDLAEAILADVRHPKARASLARLDRSVSLILPEEDL